MALRARKLVITIGVAGAAVGLTIGPAAAQTEPSGSASGLEGRLETPITDVTLPPIPLVELPPGGEDDILGVDVPGLASADLLQVQSNETGNHGAQSSAQVVGLSALPGVADVTGELIASACLSDASGSEGASTILGGEAAGTPLAISPDPNTTVDIPGVGSVTLNEQTTNGSETTVRAIHVVVDTALGVDADLAAATSVCDSGLGGSGGPNLPVEPPATPTSSTPTLAG
jgi:hypothetical protein